MIPTIITPEASSLKDLRGDHLQGHEGFLFWRTFLEFTNVKHLTFRWEPPGLPWHHGEI